MWEFETSNTRDLIDIVWIFVSYFWAAVVFNVSVGLLRIWLLSDCWLAAVETFNQSVINVPKEFELFIFGFYIFQFSLKTCFNKNSDYGNKFSLNSDIWICRSAESIYILFLQFYWLNSSFTSLRTEFIVHLMCDCLKRKTFVILLFKTVPLCCCWCVLFYPFLVWKKD